MDRRHLPASSLAEILGSGIIKVKERQFHRQPLLRFGSENSGEKG